MLNHYNNFYNDLGKIGITGNFIYVYTTSISLRSEVNCTVGVSNPFPNRGKPAGAIICNSYNLDGDCICSYNYTDSTNSQLLFVFAKRGTTAGAKLSAGTHRFAVILIY